MLPHKSTKQERQEYSNRTPREHHKNTKSSFKASLLLLKRVAAVWQQYYKRKWGRARESEEKIGQHGVAMKLDGKRGGVSFLLRERGKRGPPCMLSKWHSCKRGAPLGGRTIERGGHTLGEGSNE
jgi:hypothetical protein